MRLSIAGLVRKTILRFTSINSGVLNGTQEEIETGFLVAKEIGTEMKKQGIIK